MTWAAWLFGTLLAATLAAAVHVRWGRGCLTLTAYTLVAEIGFWLGHTLAQRQGWDWGRWGALTLGPALTLSLALLALTAFLLYTPPPPPQPRRPGREGRARKERKP